MDSVAKTYRTHRDGLPGGPNIFRTSNPNLEAQLVAIKNRPRLEEVLRQLCEIGVDSEGPAFAQIPPQVTHAELLSMEPTAWGHSSFSDLSGDALIHLAMEKTVVVQAIALTPTEDGITATFIPNYEQSIYMQAMNAHASLAAATAMDMD